MMVRLHPRATTTPRIRREIQQSDRSGRELAKHYGISAGTVYKWRRRGDVSDRSHSPHNLRSSLSAVEEEAAVELRRMLDLSVDDIVAAMRAGINAGLSRSAIYRALRRRGVSSRKKVAPAIVHGRFAAESEPGFIHLDLKYLTRLGGKPSYVFVAIDRATRYVYCEIHGNRETATAAAFCERMAAHFAPCRVRVVLSDNGFEWTDRAAGRVKAKPTGKHPVDRFCAAQGIEHRLTRLRRPQTNGMVERFNRRLSEALAAKQRIRDNAGRNCFATHAERNDYIRRFVHNYNRTRLLCLQQRSPLQMMQHYLAKQYTFAGMTMFFCKRRFAGGKWQMADGKRQAAKGTAKRQAAAKKKLTPPAKARYNPSHNDRDDN